MIWALLAPGPSAKAELAEKVRGLRLGVIGCAYQLAPWADFIAASDRGWWRNYPDAMELPCQKFSMSQVSGTERVSVSQFGTTCNSGVLALECAKKLGATKILLLGFDMHGTHFFGKYTNGLRNTTTLQRGQHLKQYEQWAYANKGIETINCTPRSALTCFPKASLEDVLDGMATDPECPEGRDTDNPFP
jgi:hypothetical protein